MWSGETPPDDPTTLRKNIEPWLAALLQAEHLNLLIGNGLTTAIAHAAGATAAQMTPRSLMPPLATAVHRAASESAHASSRGEPNLEDQIRATLELIAGLRILAMAEEGESDLAGQLGDADSLLSSWQAELTNVLFQLTSQILATERAIRQAVDSGTPEGREATRLLQSFLLTFANRPPTRDRLHIFTTNYDRLIEYGCDLLGLRVLDRFVGQLSPVFRSSRLAVDMHYDPPGLRGEPRYLEGVIRLTKLHGSLDWRQAPATAAPSSAANTSHPVQIRRYPLPFGASDNSLDTDHNVIIYPNPAKDVETVAYPYAELFRDFAASICRPNSVAFTYGYGFGDDHINRILHDMLTIPSTHLVIISYGDLGGRIHTFYENVGRAEQFTLLIGNHFAHIETLLDHYLPKPTIEPMAREMAEILRRRGSQSDSTNPLPV